MVGLVCPTGAWIKYENISQFLYVRAAQVVRLQIEVMGKL